jgi:hypothetical protein
MNADAVTSNPALQPTGLAPWRSGESLSSDPAAIASYIAANPESQDAVFDRLLRTDAGAIYHVQAALDGNAAAAGNDAEPQLMAQGTNCHRLRNGCGPIFAEPNPNGTVQLSPGVQVGGGGTRNVGRLQVSEASGLSAAQVQEVNQKLATAHERDFKTKIDDAVRASGFIPGGLAVASYLINGTLTLTQAARTGGVSLLAATAYLADARYKIDRDYTIKVNDILAEYNLPQVSQNELLNSRAPNR